AVDPADPLEDGVPRAQLEGDDLVGGQVAGAVTIPSARPEEQAADDVPDLVPDAFDEIVRLDQPLLDQDGSQALPLLGGPLERAHQPLEADEAGLEEDLSQAIV